MTVVAGIGYTLISLGPAISLFVSVIAAKPLLVLTLLSSTLCWLFSLILIATIWRPFLPNGSSSGLYGLLLLSAVAFQEALRLQCWQLYLHVEGMLNKLAVRISKPQLHSVDKIELSLAIGFGHGLAHAGFFCLSLLTPAFGPATFYVDTCKQMPLFLVAALSSLGFFVIHTFSMIIAFNGYMEGQKVQQVFVPGIHLVASLMTLVNLQPGGCMLGVPLTLFCAALTLIVCWKVIWDKTARELQHSTDVIN